MYFMAGTSLLCLPLAYYLTQGNNGGKHAPAASPTVANNQAHETLSQATRRALSDRNYWLLHIGFFTCGFHIAFLVTHLPMEVTLAGLGSNVASWSLALIGLSNVVGSLFVGWCVGHFRSKYILFWMYLSRTILIAIFLMAPKTATTFFIFAVSLGLAWLATVPPTAATVGKLYGVKYLATLFGLVLFSHQVGGFLGAYLGGIVVDKFGNYQYMWYADMALAALAAVLNLPIQEPKIMKATS